MLKVPKVHQKYLNRYLIKTSENNNVVSKKKKEEFNEEKNIKLIHPIM